MLAEAKIRSQLDVGGRYEILRQAAASKYNPPIFLGTKNRCRYCGQCDPRAFRSTAHLFPEFLGVSRIISLDECDLCNKERFQKYDTALAHCVQPYLTLGHVIGKRGAPVTKGNGIRIERSGEAGKNVLISITGEPIGEHIKFDPIGRRIMLDVPMPKVRFRPRHAYKSLVKMGFGLLPENEFQHFEQLRAWLLEPEDTLEFPVLEVAVSYAHIMKPVPIVWGSLLRRVDQSDPIPYMVFILTAGAICMQIHLMPDSLDDHLRVMVPNAINIDWQLVLTGDDGQLPMTIRYKDRHTENWASRDLVEQTLRSVRFDGQMGNEM
jgi:hypothetical protein